MPVVPISEAQTGASPIMSGPAPSQGNLLMAAATMHSLGRLDKLPTPPQKKGAPRGAKVIK